jgi:hypothetical protein
MSDTPTNGNGGTPERPPWIDPNYKPGVPPVVTAKVTKEELAEFERVNAIRREEALSLWGGYGRQVMTDEQKFIAVHQERADVHKANMEVFRNEPEGRHQFTQHSIHAATHLKHLGEFEEAATVLEGIEHPEADYLRTRIAEWKHADEIPDDEECPCPPPGSDVHVDRDGKEIPMQLVAPKHHHEGEYCSKRLGQVAKVHVCAQCGHKNGKLEDSAAHSRRLQLQAHAEQQVRIKGLKGNDDGIRNLLPGHYADAVVLKVTDG